MTNNDLQTITQKTNDRATRTPLKTEVNPIAPGRLAVQFPHVAPDIIESIQMYDLIENIIHLHHLYCYSRHLLLHVARILLSCRKITLIDRLLHFEFNNSFLM